MSTEDELEAILHAARAVDDAFAESAARQEVQDRSDDRWFWLYIVAAYLAVVGAVVILPLALTGHL